MQTMNIQIDKVQDRKILKENENDQLQNNQEINISSTSSSSTSSSSQFQTNNQQQIEQEQFQLLNQNQYLSNDYNEGTTQRNKRKIILKATIDEREQIINHFSIVINIEKGFLLHVTLSVILCILIQCGFFLNHNNSSSSYDYFQNPLNYSDQKNNLNSNPNNLNNNNNGSGLISFHNFIPNNTRSISGFVDYYLISMIQNCIYVIILARIIREDTKFLYLMKKILNQERNQVQDQSNSNNQKQLNSNSSFGIEQTNNIQSEQSQNEQGLNTNNQSRAISLIDSLIQENFIIQRRNSINIITNGIQQQQQEQRIEKIDEVLNNKEFKKCQKEDTSFLKVIQELYQFESSIIHHRVTSKKDHITLYNVLENITETQNFGSKLLIASSTVILFIFNIAQIGTHTLDPQYEIGILAYLGIPAMMMILPFCVVLLTLATSVLFLMIYGISILFLLTYSVISKQVLLIFKIIQLNSKLLKYLPQLIGRTCSICLCDFDHPLEKVSLLKCNHPFHYECFKLWMSEKDDCPVCRKKY